MARFWVIAAVVAAAFMIYSLVDCAMTDRSRIRGPRKGVWLLIILLPVLGGLLWFLVGRGRASGRPTRTVAPDDDPAFLRRLAQDKDQEERIRRLEQELADLDGDGPPPQERLPERDKDSDGGDKPDRRDA
ncbi:PLD nuclease N-terminal domain-containing protein [Naasia sp. SYSU D00948]|uniref:PLD nuclease N-terminal domain-containing protein n=1 Tax=Naasia sp. SYSU D00948 TaxID=2817379 RepID=UPI001B315711|nr:PLD nuclease N-terminal domain-containing protein [Naasia sp. SYSU D00948]